MIARGITGEQLEQAAREVGVELDKTEQAQSGLTWRVKVNPGPGRKYPRVSNQGRNIHAVCWHGFRDFFRAAFKLAPNAVFKTAYDTWRGRDDFETRYRDSGYRNIGSNFAPMSAAEACRCKEAGYAD